MKSPPRASRPEGPKSRVWVVGHRGAMAYAPENTRASFEKAFRLGVDAVECDVHLSKDNQVVVIHDATLDRTAGGRGPVRRQTWRALSRLNAGSWFSPAFRRERLWRLSDLLRWAKNKKSPGGVPLRLLVEIKDGAKPYPGIARRVAGEISRARLEERVVVIAFNHALVRRLKKISPRTAGGLLYSTAPRGLARRMAWAKADAVFPRHNFVTGKLMAQAEKNGWWVGTWTVNERRDMERLRRLGVHAIASNVPDLLRRQLLRPLAGLGTARRPRGGRNAAP